MSFFNREKQQEHNPETVKAKLTEQDAAQLNEKIIAALRTVYDPEIPVNIFDLGLIYKVSIDEDSMVGVDMTLTAPACPVAGTLPGQVENCIKELDDVADAKVTLVWEPPWNRELISDEAKLSLGIL
ncbi:MAG: DUF59 domain-containing protein [Gammaproteobacteria bacterium]|nr:DUF59 domain-containing protein [Gammaproteobacteria bacterium]